MKFLFIVAFYPLFSLETSMESLIKANSVEGLIEAEQFITEINRSQKLCGGELDRHSFPFHCFLYLDSSLSQTRILQDWDHIFQRVSRLCVLNSGRILSTQTIQTILQTRLASPNCARALEERLKGLQYAQETSVGPNIEIKMSDEKVSSRKSLLRNQRVSGRGIN